MVYDSVEYGGLGMLDGEASPPSHCSVMTGIALRGQCTITYYHITIWTGGFLEPIYHKGNRQLTVLTILTSSRVSDQVRERPGPKLAFAVHREKLHQSCKSIMLVSYHPVLVAALAVEA